VIAFSYLVIEGLQRLDVGLSDQEAEDLYYLWQVFARMAGIPISNMAGRWSS